MFGWMKRKSFCSAVIVAAGNASRMGGIDKIMAPLDGKPVIWHTVHAFQENPDIHEIVVVTSGEKLVDLAQKCKDWGFTKVTAVVCGGENRVQSVANGCSAASKKAAYLAIHDGARPLVSQSVISETVKKCRKFSASAPAIPVKDTVKIARSGVVESTPERKNLMAIQTPQVFDADLLKAALVNASEKGLDVTDDCSCVEAMGMRVVLSKGEERNMKITTPFDLEIAELWLKKGE